MSSQFFYMGFLVCLFFEKICQGIVITAVWPLVVSQCHHPLSASKIFSIDKNWNLCRLYMLLCSSLHYQVLVLLYFSWQQRMTRVWVNGVIQWHIKPDQQNLSPLPNLRSKARYSHMCSKLPGVCAFRSQCSFCVLLGWILGKLISNYC